jgi:hypothetical protein
LTKGWIGQHFGDFSETHLVTLFASLALVDMVFSCKGSITSKLVPNRMHFHQFRVEKTKFRKL